MQEVVDAMNSAAKSNGSFGKIADHLIDSAKKNDYPLHFAWERSADFTQAFRGSEVHDADASASFAIVARADSYTYKELEALFRDVVSRARSENDGLEPGDFDAFDAHFGGTKVRLLLYTIQKDTNASFNR